MESFLNSSVRALKHGMQELAAVLGVDIGFLFKKQSKFKAGLARMEKSDPLLAEYLRNARAWLEPLLDRRNAMEHLGWMLPAVAYSVRDGRVAVDQPSVLSQPVCEFADFMLDRLSCFVEEVTAHCVQGRLPPEIGISEVQPPRRAPEAPERFLPTPASGGMPVWKIRYHSSRLEET